ncbi:hypothetical protein [Desulfoluna sp.]|uniref:hypothetical protein n=1 Tax=Desulfoluna sp. TaxID=2045199 RepID=UPI00260BFDE3|nr:hypothetical protein [Desulfoluna sp.]
MKNTLTIALTVALILLAGAMAWLACSIQGVTKELPAILSHVEEVNTRIDDIVDTIPLITNALPPVMAEVEEIRKTVPSILTEMAQVRNAVPAILEEVEKIRETLPSILTRVDAIQAQAKELETHLPLLTETVNTVTAQVETALPLIEQALKESEAIRLQIPDTLTRVEVLVADAQGIAGKASQEAVTGMVKGVLTSPFKLLMAAGNSITGSLFTTRKLTQEDEKRVVEATARLLNNMDLKSTHWANPDSGIQGTVSLQRAFKDGDTACVSLRFDLIPKSGKKEHTVKNGCLADDGTWQMQ